MTRGVLLLVFGLGEGALILRAFRTPYTTASVLAGVMAGFLLIDGVTALVGAVRAPDRSSWRGLQALSGIAAGVLILLLAPGRAVRIFGWWAIVTGLLRAADSPPSRSVRILVATLSLALGLLIVGDAFRDPVRALLAISVYGVIAGALLLVAPRSGHRRRAGAEVR